MLTFIDGEFTQPGPWSLDGAAALGRMLRDLHAATRTFRPPDGAVWYPWHGRGLGSASKIIGHCDVAPWNIVARDGLPVALIDWEFAGPVDPLVELAQLCWLNAKLHDDIVAEIEGLPPLAERTRQLAAIADGYGQPDRSNPVGPAGPGHAPRAGLFNLVSRHYGTSPAFGDLPGRALCQTIR
jgi:Ser/Thr protein kinase RdoA (MazF antagonist)